MVNVISFSKLIPIEPDSYEKHPFIVLLLSKVTKNSLIVISFSSYGSKHCYWNGLFAESCDNFAQKNVKKLIFITWLISSVFLINWKFINFKSWDRTSQTFTVFSYYTQTVVFGYCYHSVNVIRFNQSQSDHIKRLLLYSESNGGRFA